MNAQERKLVEEKLRSLKTFALEMEPHLKISREKFERDVPRKRIIERLTQVIVECAIDANGLLIQALNLPPPRYAKESFQLLNQQQILDEYITERYAEHYVGLRNVIVHLYEKVDAKTLYYSAKRLLTDSDEYIAQVQKFLTPRKKNNSGVRS